MRSAAAAMRTPGPDVSKLTVAWVGRMLRTAGVVPKGAIARRERLYGLNLILLRFDPHYLVRVQDVANDRTRQTVDESLAQGLPWRDPWLS
ncbi:MAG: hypothetical protein QOK24_2785 [Verrucomicrobiota bacterium]|jgi:hypothetical protein